MSARPSGSKSNSAPALSDFDFEVDNDLPHQVGRLPLSDSGSAATHPPRDDEMGEVLHAALREHRLTAHFQPIMTVANGNVAAVEALSRLRLPDGQLLSAGQYVEVAERLGLAPVLDLSVMAHALHAAREAAYSGVLFLNVSPHTLMRGDFVARAKRAAGEFGVPPSRIVFEITERQRIADIERARQIVRDLRGDGFGFAIDDFGSGFASHQYLQQLPVDFVKIAGDFVAGMLANPRDAVLVEEMANLARRLSVRTVAEYVENQAAAERIRRIGIDYAQGYLIGQPVAGLPRNGTRGRACAPAQHHVAVPGKDERKVQTTPAKPRDMLAAGNAAGPTANRSQEPSALSLKQAIDAHVAWHEWMRGVVHGTNTLNADIASVALEDRCPLDRWIRGVGAARYRHLAEYRDLRELLTQFHRLAMDAVLEYESGNGETARQIADGALRKLSGQVQLQIVRLFGRAGL
jgi:EAL domain-containing protein (putative c-di-GMP-specific phosphodiesterase class I)